MRTPKHCAGCYNDVYNHGCGGATECWHLKTAALVTLYRIYRDTPMNQKSGYEKVRKPDCYHQAGWAFLTASQHASNTK